MDSPKFIKTDIPCGQCVLPLAHQHMNWVSMYPKLSNLRPSNTLGTDLESTFSFVNQIKNIDVTGAKMVSFDVRSLFTNIPLKKAIKVCLDRFI